MMTHNNTTIIRLLLITNNVASYVGDSVERREFRFMVLANIVKSSQKLHNYCTDTDDGNINRYASIYVSVKCCVIFGGRFILLLCMTRTDESSEHLYTFLDIL